MVSPEIFTFPGRAAPYPDTSFWLCCDGEIVGWLITARWLKIPCVMGYFISGRSCRGGTGRAIPLLAQVIRKQLELGIIYGCCSVNYHPDRSNPNLRLFYEKRLKPNATFLVGVFYQAKKQFLVQHCVTVIGMGFCARLLGKLNRKICGNL